MSDLADVVALVQREPGRTALELRDQLRRLGRVSITIADILRILTGNPNRFQASCGPEASGSTRWSPRQEAGGLLPPPVVAPWPGPPLYRWQVAALLAWRAQGERGVIEAVTGTGKTMVGIAAAYDELARGGQVAVVVPTKDLLYQWQAALRRLLASTVEIGLVGDCHDDGLGHRDVVVAVVNSVRGGQLVPRRPGGLLIADECHRYGSLENRAALGEGFPRRLGLSATYARADDAHESLLDPYFGGRCFRMGYDQALRDGVIAPFRVALVGVRFSEEEYADYDEFGVEMAIARVKLLRSGVVRAEPVGAFLTDVARLSRGNSELASSALGYLRAMSERRRLLAETPAKRAVLGALGEVVRSSRRSIVFTQGIAAAERASGVLGALGIASEALHSGLSSGRRRDLLARFSAGQLTVLCAPTVLDEGVDVPAADLAIIVAASRSRRQMVQRLGRVLRRKADGRAARLVVLTVEGTAEDPASGAHEGFLDEITPVAIDLRHFPAGSEPGLLSAYLLNGNLRRVA